MSSFFNCVAYDNVDTTIRLHDHVVFVTLKSKKKDSDVHLTLNPFQIRMLAKYLSVALSQIDFNDLKDENLFGDLTVQFELDTPPKLDSNNDFYDNALMYGDEYAVAVPF